MLHLKAKLDVEHSEGLEDLDCYTAELDDGDGHTIDFYFPKGQQLTTMDIHVEFERDED